MARLEVSAKTGLAAAVAAGERTLKSRIVQAVRGRSVRFVTDPQTARDLEFLLSLTLRAIGEGRTRAVGVHEPELARIGAAWAADGRPLDDVWAAQRIAQGAIADHVREVGREIRSQPAEVLDTLDVVLTACNAVVAAVAAGYHGAGPRQDPAERQRAEFVRGLLWGSLGPAELRRHARDHGIDTERAYRALRARPAIGRTAGELARAHGFTAGRAPCGGLGAVVDGDLVGFLAAAPPRDVPGVSGLGPVRPLELLHESFRMASRALDTAQRRGLTGVQEFGKLGLLPAVFSDVMAGEALCRKYLTALGDSESAMEIVETLRAYLANGMNVGRTAERMFVHPNTVRYRIGRFEELTGVSSRSSPKTVFELLWVLEHRCTQGCTRMPRTCEPRSCAPPASRQPAEAPGAPPPAVPPPPRPVKAAAGQPPPGTTRRRHRPA